MSFDRRFVLSRLRNTFKHAFFKAYAQVVGACSQRTLANRKLAGHLRPGGLVVFHEPSWDGVRSFPPSPTYDRCWQWIVDTFERVGTEMRMGLKLYATFIAAGLPAPSMRLSAVIGGGSSDWLNVIAENVRSLLPEMERLGVATAAEVGVETLADRLRKEVAASGGVIVGRSEIAAWSRVQA